MSIVRAARKSTFYVCPSSVIEDRRLSWSARGLLVYLLSKPDNWFIQIKDLLNQTASAIGGRSGRDKVYKLLNELRAAGYVYQEFVREGGGFKGVEYEVSDTPDLEQAAAYIASVQAKAARRGDTQQPFPELPETVAPYRETPFPEKPETLDSTESAITIERAVDPTEVAEVALPVPGQPDNYPRLASSPIHATWQAYAVAYHARYKTWPVFNRTVAGIVTKLIGRIGEQAPQTATYFVEREDSAALKDKCHPIAWLLKDCEGFATKAVLFAKSKKRAKQMADYRAQAIPAAPVAPETNSTVKQPSNQALEGINALRAIRKHRGTSQRSAA